MPQAHEIRMTATIRDHHEEIPAGLNDLLVIHCDAADKKKGGNASHQYRIDMDVKGDARIEGVARIQFQHGPRNERGSTRGVTDASILAILIDRYRGFQSGPFACRENEKILDKLEEALHWMKARAQARHQRGVLGKLEA